MVAFILPSIMTAAYSSSICSTRSWSNLPLDLLISIAERVVVRSDLLSFRFVCSDWRSAVPCPKHLPWYTTWQTCTDNENHSDFLLIHHEVTLSIPLPFPSSGYRTKFLFASNGWLLFVTDYYSYYLFDPVSHQKHWLPPLITRQKRRQSRNDIISNRSVLDKAVVSMSRNGGIAVAGIAETYNQMGDFIGSKFSFIEINDGKEKSWRISKKSCVNKMVGIVGGGDQEKRFYAADENWGLYLLEAGSLMRWRRFNLMLPKHISKGHDSEMEDNQKKRPHVYCCGLRETSDGYLEVHGICLISWRSSSTFLLLKVQRSGLRIDSKNVNAYGDDEKWTDKIPSTYISDYTYIPRL